MKKFLSLFCFGTSLLFAYSTWDVGTADYLAERGVIKDFRHNVSGYRLDATISRQEVVGIAMKMASQSQPQEYVCQNHFTDVRFPPNHTDAWVCASVEWASGRGIVSRENTRFRPKDSITKAEALAILMQAYGINITKNVDTGFNDMPVISLYRPQTPQWQIDLIESAHVNGIIDAYTDTL